LLRSALDDIPGIGKARKALLIRHFGTVDGIRAAAVDDISGLPGFTRNLAETVRAALNASR
jgi:excinuclease ABC subunit C